MGDNRGGVGYSSDKDSGECQVVGCRRFRSVDIRRSFAYPEGTGPGVIAQTDGTTATIQSDDGSDTFRDRATIDQTQCSGIRSVINRGTIIFTHAQSRIDGGAAASVPGVFEGEIALVVAGTISGTHAAAQTAYPVAGGQ